MFPELLDLSTDVTQLLSARCLERKKKNERKNNERDGLHKCTKTLFSRLQSK